MAEKDNQSKRLYQMNAAQFFTSLQGLQRRNFILSSLDNLVIKMTLKFVLNLEVTSKTIIRTFLLIHFFIFLILVLINISKYLLSKTKLIFKPNFGSQLLL